MSRDLHSLIPALMTFTIFVGCKHADPNAIVTAPHQETKSASRAGWVDVSTSGFTISLPADMQVKDWSQGQINNFADSAKQKHPNEQKALDALKKDGANGHLKLVATQKHPSASGFRDAVAVLVEPNKGSKTLADLLQSNEESLEKISEPGSIVGEQIRLPSGRAARIHWNHLRPGAATMASSTYLIVHGDQILVFSFASHLEDKVAWAATAQSVMESLRFDH